MPKKGTNTFEMHEGDAEARKKAEAHVAKLKEKAAKELLKSKGGFALFTVKSSRRKDGGGVQQMVAGAMSIPDTIHLAMIMQQTAQQLLDSIQAGMREMDGDER